MKIGSAFPSKHLKASDLNGQQATVVIEKVKSEEVGMDKETKPIVYFQGKKKGLCLNKTNSRMISKIAGTDETDNWTGVSITMYPTETEFQGDTVDCIRIRAPKVNAAMSPLRKPAPEPEEDPYGNPEAESFHASDDDVSF